MCVDFLFHHGDHVERVAHGVEAQDPGKLFKTRPERERENEKMNDTSVKGVRLETMIYIDEFCTLNRKWMVKGSSKNCQKTIRTFSQRALSSHTESRCTCYHPPMCL